MISLQKHCWIVVFVTTVFGYGCIDIGGYECADLNKKRCERLKPLIFDKCKQTCNWCTEEASDIMEWGNWSEYGECVNGKMSKTRECSLPGMCEGKSRKTISCVGIWSPCSKTCGVGHRYKYTKCTKEVCNRIWSSCIKSECKIHACKYPKYWGHYNYKTYNKGTCCKVDENAKCGMVERDLFPNRIIGGHISNWPWLGYLMTESLHTSTNSQGQYVTCGVTLVHEQWAITAARCFTLSESPADFNSTFGKAYAYGTAQHFGIEKIIIHPDYVKDSSSPSDISLIKLDRPTHFTKFVRKICLPNVKDFPVDFSCTTAGLTPNDFLQKDVNPPLKSAIEAETFKYPQAICRDKYQRDKRGNMTGYFDEKICAGNLKNNESACKLTPGTPLMCQSSNSCTWRLIGIQSFFGSLMDNWYSCVERLEAYTDVFTYVDWIKKQISDDGDVP